MTNDFNQLIAQQTGIIIRDSEQKYLDKIIVNRCQHLRLSDSEAYFRLLSQPGQESNKEWQALTSLITNNESYFFRDEEQFKIIQNSILPEIIDRHRDDRTLRICSCGCSTGQEPYTLAIILHELLPDLRDWNITILGIDIDEAALETARKGIYESWSFRGVKSIIKEKYFQQVDRQYHLQPEIRNIVNFQSVNLVKSNFPQVNGALRDFDLIICRNVFIYFERSAIELILDKFYRSLQPSGYLIVGHTELYGHNIDQFKIKVFDHSLVYQRPSREEDCNNIGSNNIIKNFDYSQQSQLDNRLNSAEKDLKTVSSIKQNLLSIRQELELREIRDNNQQSIATKKILDLELCIERIAILRENQLHQKAIEELKTCLQEYPDRINLYYSLAEINADIGNYTEAQDYCQQALTINSFAIEVHYLLAQIAEAQEKKTEAKQILKKVLYLNPSFIPAYLNLSQIYRQEGDDRRAEKMKIIAIDILQKLPPNSIIPEMGSISVARAIEHLN
jgi:chemotaxis protein methyltransferase CheR